LTDDELTLPRLIRRNAEIRGEQIAMRYKRFGIWHTYTWGTVWGQASALAAGLELRLPANDSCLAIIGDNEPELFWAEYAALCLGRPVMCLFPDISATELAELLQRYAITAVICEDQEQCDKVLDAAESTDVGMLAYWDERGMRTYDDKRLVSFTELIADGQARLSADPHLIDARVDRVGLDDLAVVILTSGTSSEPKGVMGTHRYLIDCASRWRDVLDAKAQADYVSYISPAWATEQYLGVTLGAMLPLVVNFVEEPETVERDIREIGAHYVFFGPRQWEGIASSIDLQIRDAGRLVRAIYRWSIQILHGDAGGGASRLLPLKRLLAWQLIGRPVRDRLGFSRLRTAINSGGALGPELFELLQALGVSVRNVYGFTEVGIITSTADGQRFETVGQRLASKYGDPIEIRIHEGEIQVRGGVPFVGYYLEEGVAASGKLTPDGWIRSGDGGYLTDDEYLVYLDRLEDMITTADGEILAPGFFETRLRLSPYIRDVAVVAPDGASLVALVEVDEGVVGNWGEQRHVALGDFATMSQHPGVIELVREEIAGVNRLAAEGARVQRFANLYKKLDADDGEMTRSRKLRRSVVTRKYAELLSALARGDAEVDSVSEVRLTNGATTSVRARVCLNDVLECPRSGDGPGPAGTYVKQRKAGVRL